jgi:hypothetical protein
MLAFAVAGGGCIVTEDPFVQIGDATGYIIDARDGIYEVQADTDGNLALVGVPPITAGEPRAAVTNRAGTHLYVIDGATPQLLDFTLSPGGHVYPVARATPIGCIASSVLRHRSDRLLVIGCETPNLAVASLAPDGTVEKIDLVAPGGELAPHKLAFSDNGLCMVASDRDREETFSYQVDENTRTITRVGPQPGGGLGVATRGQHIYTLGPMGTVGGRVFHRYTLGSGCTLLVCCIEMVTEQAEHAIVDPGGNYIFAVGLSVDTFSINNVTGDLTRALDSPFLPGNPFRGVTFDPDHANILYLTGPTYGGTVPATLDNLGRPTLRPALVTGGSASIAFVLRGD